MNCKKLVMLAPLVLLSANPARAADPAPSLSRLPHGLESIRRGGRLLAAPATNSGLPNFTFFDMPSSTNTEAGALNLGVGGAASRVVGCYVPYSSTTGSYEGFEYTLSTQGPKSTATFETIGPTNVNYCPYAINDSGVIVGSYQPNGTPAEVYDGFVLDGTTLTTLTAPYSDTCQTFPSAVNDAGTVVGEYVTNVSCTSDDGFAEGGFSWSNGTYTLIPGPTGSIDSSPSGINTAGTIVGSAFNGTETKVFGWMLRNGVYTMLNYPGASVTYPNAINDSGEIVGAYCADTFNNCNANGGPYQSFLYQAGVFSTIAGVPDNNLLGINNKGVISGYYEDTNGYYHSFLINP